jgi:hypothetical protein
MRLECRLYHVNVQSLVGTDNLLGRQFAEEYSQDSNSWRRKWLCRDAEKRKFRGVVKLLEPLFSTDDTPPL